MYVIKISNFVGSSIYSNRVKCLPYDFMSDEFTTPVLMCRSIHPLDPNFEDKLGPLLICYILFYVLFTYKSKTCVSFTTFMVFSHLDITMPRPKTVEL